MSASVAQLANAINKLASEKNQGMVASHVRTITQGVQEIGRRLTDIESRLKKLETKHD